MKAMKLATIFNPKGERVSYMILKDKEVKGFTRELAEDGRHASYTELNDDSVAVALRECEEDGAFFLATCLFEAIYEATNFLGSCDISDKLHITARAIYDIRKVEDRVAAAREDVRDIVRGT